MNYVGPMIDNNNEKLQYAIEHLEPGESWLVAPEFVDEKKYILKPTVKWGVKPTSYTFKNELFAPLLSVVCIDNLKQGIEYVNSSEYGLTSGLQSLNEEEQTLWKNSIEAGNLYINRGITGAIVRRQPFGGMKRSAFGGGIKAGGPNYVSCFVEFTENKLSNTELPDSPLSELLSIEGEKLRLNFAWTSYQTAWQEEFSQEKEVSYIYGEENIFRYLPLKNIGFRVQEKDNPTDILLVIMAAHISRTPLTVSIPPECSHKETIERSLTFSGVKIKIQDEQTFIHEMDKYERIRTCTPDLSDEFYQKAAELGKHIANNKPVVEGRLELLHYLKEQSIAYEYHRYGSIFGEEK
jgi:RHH-type proline utilization regulon transcriptional repressor/proline dehydrogenase/delta 1-pyrroline-5-carboxylate dehydrogenase